MFRVITEYSLCIWITVRCHFWSRVMVVTLWMKVFTVKANPFSFSTVSFCFSKDSSESHDITQSHLKSLILGQLLILTPLWNHLSQTIKGCVQPLHPSSLPGIGSQSSLCSTFHPFWTALHNTAWSTSALDVWLYAWIQMTGFTGFHIWCSVSFTDTKITIKKFIKKFLKIGYLKSSRESTHVSSLHTSWICFQMSMIGYFS